MKKIILVSLLLVSEMVMARNFQLEKSTAEYTVKHLVKTVKGTSAELKGKLVCEKEECDFLIAAPVKSFISSDSNRDLNMQTIMESTQFPLVTAKGKFPEKNLLLKKWTLKALVSLHGIEKEYTAEISGLEKFKGEFVLKLEEHKIERPSLFTVKIENEVPMNFELNWKELKN